MVRVARTGGVVVTRAINQEEKAKFNSFNKRPLNTTMMIGMGL